VTKIVASCPHCFNTLGNEYPDFGGRYEVMHHTELLAELVRDGRIEPKTGDAQITYHDSCYLARHNDVMADPRQLVEAVGTPVEMERSGKRTFCCGAGGAHMWMEERGSAINEERVRQADETGAETLAVACPFCTVMLDDGVRTSGSKLRVADVATLLAESWRIRLIRVTRLNPTSRPRSCAYRLSHHSSPSAYPALRGSALGRGRALVAGRPSSGQLVPSPFWEVNQWPAMRSLISPSSEPAAIAT
jgi:hypothetical protein